MREEIDLQELWKALVRHRMPIVCAFVVATILASIFCFGFMADEYSAKTTLYILNQQNSENITSSDLTASATLVNDYRELILSNKVTDMVEEDLGLEDLDDFNISVEALNNTRFIEIGVTGEDAYLVAAIANDLANAFSKAVVEIMRVDNVSIVDVATIPEEPSGPPRERNIAIAAVAAAVLAAGVVIVIEVMNTSLKDVQDVEKETGLSVLAQFSQLTEAKGHRR